MPLNRLRTEVQCKFNLKGDDFTLVVRDETRYEVESQPALQIALKWAIQHGRLLMLSVKLGFPRRHMISTHGVRRVPLRLAGVGSTTSLPPQGDPLRFRFEDPTTFRAPPL